MCMLFTVAFGAAKADVSPLPTPQLVELEPGGGGEGEGPDVSTLRWEVLSRLC